MNNNHFEKTCETCGKIFFAKTSIAKRCPDCRVAWMKEYKAHWNRQPENRERNTQLQRKYRSTPKGARKNRESAKKYWLAHREECLKRHREYREKNRELLNLNARIAYYDKCAAKYY